MSLVTLSGTISHTDVNTNFSDKLATLVASNEKAGAAWPIEVEELDLDSASVGAFVDFVAPCDLEVELLALTVWSPDVTSRTVTLRIAAIDEIEEEITKYMEGATNYTSVTVTSSGISHAARPDFRPTTGERILLIRGVTYRLSLACDNASPVDRAQGLCIVRSRWGRE